MTRHRWTHSGCYFTSHPRIGLLRTPKRLKLLTCMCIVAYVILLPLTEVAGNYKREPRLRTTSSWKAILSWISDPVQYLPQDKPFFAVWNAPSFPCGHKYGLPMDLQKFGIVDNEFELFHGQTINLFYESRLGLYPRYLPNGKAKYGGIPQLGNLTSHLDWVRTDIDWYIPNVTYNGLAVIDWESWRPLFVRNWGKKSIYREASEKLVQKLHPTWSRKLVAQEAQRQFEKAARSFMLETLFLCRRLRPRAKWGFYLFPECYNHPPGRDKCTQAARDRNDRLSWLYKSSSALYPSIYLHAEYSPREQRQHVRGVLQEAYRVRNKFTSKYLPVIPYSRYVYAQSDGFYNKVALENTIGQAAISGANGVVLWDSSSNFKTEKQCKRLHKYLNSVMGPYVKSVLNWTERCTQARCSGHGRCVSPQYMKRHPTKPGRVTIGRGPVITQVKVPPDSRGHALDKKNLFSETVDKESSARKAATDRFPFARTTLVGRSLSTKIVPDGELSTRKTVVDKEPSTKRPVAEKVSRFTKSGVDKIHSTRTAIFNILPSAGTVTQTSTNTNAQVAGRKTSATIMATSPRNYAAPVSGSTLTSLPALPDDDPGSKTSLSPDALSSSTTSPKTTPIYRDSLLTGSTRPVFKDKEQEHVLSPGHLVNNNKTKVYITDFANKTNRPIYSTKEGEHDFTSDVPLTRSRHTPKQQTDAFMSTSEGAHGVSGLTTDVLMVTKPNQYSWTGHRPDDTSEIFSGNGTQLPTDTTVSSREADNHTISANFTAESGLTRRNKPEMTTVSKGSVLDIQPSSPIYTVNINEISDPKPSVLNTFMQVIIIIMLNILRVFRQGPTHDDDRNFHIQSQSLYSKLQFQDDPRVVKLRGGEHSRLSDRVVSISNSQRDGTQLEEAPNVYHRHKRRMTMAKPLRKWVMSSALNTSSGLVIQDNTDLHQNDDGAKKSQAATSLGYPSGQLLETQISNGVLPDPESEIVISDNEGVDIRKTDHRQTDERETNVDDISSDRTIEKEFGDFVCVCYSGWTGQVCNEKV